MAIPSVNITFAEGGLATVLPGPGGAQFKVGVSLGGTPYTVYACGSPSAASSLLVGGPLHDAVRHVTDVAGTTVYAVPCEIDSFGGVSPSTLTHVGTGTMDVTASCAPHVQVSAKCTKGGTLGTAEFAFSVDGGAYGTPVVSTSNSFSYRVPGTFCELTFSAATYTAGDTYTVATNGTVTRTSGAPDTVTFTAGPVDAYELLVEVVTGGARGTSRFKYSLDGGVTKSASIATAAKYAIPRTGIVLEFSNETAVAGDTYSATCSPPTANNTSIGLAIDAAVASKNMFEGGHIVQTPSTASDAASLATLAASKVASAASAYRYIFIVTECPTGGANTDQAIAQAFENITEPRGRVFTCAGYTYMVSPATGLTLKRNCAWALAPRLASTKMSTNPGEVLLGALPNVVSITRDESATPGLHDARLVTMRTYIGRSGYYFTGAPTLAELTSDYRSIMNVRVVNRAATVAYAAFVEYLNMDVRVDKNTGKIAAQDADAIDRSVTQRLASVLTGAPGTRTDECSAVTARLSRTDNILSSGTVNATIAVVPKGYMETIYVDIGLSNPALRS